MRTILHCDINNCYASIECRNDPALQGRPVAVTGSTEMRHGIVLAKNQIAKGFGVKTGDVIWEAKMKCPGLICVPPHYDEYLKVSRQVKEIYLSYTDMVEPFGIDECWLDVTPSTRLFGCGHDIAYEIKERVKEEVGITISAGVSFNKIFAKLGSDMKKPDAVTDIPEESFRELIWDLPCESLIFCGRATTKKLNRYAIHTIGDLANAREGMMRSLLGVNGVFLWHAARGEDRSRVMPSGITVPVKSVGHGITTYEDLVDGNDVWKVFLELSQDIGHRLRKYDLKAKGVQITVRCSDLHFMQLQGQLAYPTQSPLILARKAMELFEDHYSWDMNVRALTVRAIGLMAAEYPDQLILNEDHTNEETMKKLDDAVDDIRARFGKNSIRNAILLTGTKIPSSKPDNVVMPSAMYR